MTDEQNTEKSLKIILLGESGVGKTNLINVFMGKEFEQNSFTSLSSSYIDGVFSFKGKDFPYVIWDTAGQESYRSLNQIFLKNSKIIILVYSVDDEKSFQELNYWIDLVKNELEEDYVMAICGNKIDLFDEQRVKEEDAENYAEKHGLKLKFTSALTDPQGFKLFLNEIILDYLVKAGKVQKGVEQEKNQDIQNSFKINKKVAKKEKIKKKFC